MPPKPTATFGEVINDVGFKEAARLLGRRGGKAKSDAKTEAARLNGRKGGRPRKPKP
jgi:hypothetical protein